MVFNNYNQTNNASGSLVTLISNSSTLLILNSGEGEKFPTTNFKVRIRQFDVSGIYIKQEIALCTSRSGDTLTVIRANEECPLGQNSTTQQQQAQAFGVGSTIDNIMTAEDATQTNNEVVSLRTDTDDNTANTAANTAAIANLANAQGSFGSTTTINLTTSEQTIDFDLIAQSSDTSLFSIDETGNKIDIISEGNYNFSTNMTFQFTGNNVTETVTIRGKKVSDDSEIYSRTLQLTGDNNNTKVTHTATLLVVGPGKDLEAPAEMYFTIESTGTNIDVLEFDSIISLGGSISSGGVVATQSDVTLGESVSVGDALYIDSGDGKAYKTDASDSNKINFIGFTGATGVLDDTIKLNTAGVDGNQSGMIIGEEQYLADDGATIDFSNYPKSNSNINTAKGFFSTSFLASYDTIKEVRTHIKQSNTTNGSNIVSCEVYNVDGNNFPTTKVGTLTATQTVDYTASNNLSEYIFTFSNSVSVSVGTRYAIVFTSEDGNYQLGMSYVDSGTNLGISKSKVNQFDVWVNSSDLNIAIYRETVAGTISSTPGTNSVKIGKAISASEIEINTFNNDLIFPRNIYVSDEIAIGASGDALFTHSLGLTESDVQSGRYKVIITCKTLNAGVQLGDTYGDSNRWGSNIVTNPLSPNVLNYWGTTTSNISNRAMHQENTLKVYLSVGTNMEKIRAIIQQMF